VLKDLCGGWVVVCEWRKLDVEDRKILTCVKIQDDFFQAMGMDERMWFPD
jgi:hypothetical protein